MRSAAMLQLFRVNVRTISQTQRLKEELQRVHLQRRCRVFHRGHREEAACGMIGRAPRALPAPICPNPFADDVVFGILVKTYGTGGGP